MHDQAGSERESEAEGLLCSSSLPSRPVSKARQRAKQARSAPAQQALASRVAGCTALVRGYHAGGRATARGAEEATALGLQRLRGRAGSDVTCFLKM
jgi:hypothetical protein